MAKGFKDDGFRALDEFPNRAANAVATRVVQRHGVARPPGEPLKKGEAVAKPALADIARAKDPQAT
jgi:hypothetical protein